MATRFTKEQWRDILDLASVAVKYPVDQRRAFLAETSSNPDVVEQVLLLTEAFEQPQYATDHVGAKIGHFAVTKHIGQGGMGDVYLAWDIELERQVALKFLNPESMALEGAGERFIREARMASALNHPNIVTIHEVIRSESTVAIAMELVEGVPLQDLFATPPLVHRQARIGRQIADALAAAHAAGIVHRDMKPANVMVKPDGRVKVLDFGLARRFSASNSTGGLSATDTFAGTWRYMSPEQIRGEAITGLSDVFSLGLMLYEMATGEHPFKTASPFETMQGIVNQEAQPPSKLNGNLPSRFEALILMMLAKDPKGRPTAKQIAEALEEWETGSANPALMRQPPARSRRLWTLPVLIATALAAGILTGIWRWYGSKNSGADFTQVTTLVPENRATAAAISPDGGFTAYANVDGIFLRTNQNGETVPLRSPANFIVDQLSWFASGSKLIASGFSPTTNQRSIWSIPITSAEPSRLRIDARQGVPSPDGTRIAYISSNSTSIWIMGASGVEPHQVVSGPGDDIFLLVFWSADGKHLGFQRRHYSGKQDLGYVMIDRFFLRSLESYDLDKGTIVPLLPDVWVESASTLADGQVILLRSDNRGSDIFNDLWEINPDAAKGWAAGSLHHVDGPIGEKNDRTYGISATADGKKIMMLRRTDQNAVFVANFNPAPPRFSDIRRLTLEERSSYPHAWTADSQAVIFESDRNGTWDIFQQRIDERTASIIVATPKRWDVLPQLSPDGRSILYALGSLDGNPGAYTLMRVLLPRGVPEVVPTDGPLDEFRCAPGGCVLRTSLYREYHAFYELDPIRGKGRELARTSWAAPLVGDWTMSPDAKQVAIPNHELGSAKIRVLDLTGHTRERTLNIAGLTDVLEVTWAADGQGWFVTVSTSIGSRMVFVRLDGALTPLGDIQGWAVPAPDGHKVAFLNRIIASNAWLVTLH